MIPFQPMGNLASFTGATSAPTSVRSMGAVGVSPQVFHLNNTDASIDCVVGWGDTDTTAKINAAAGTNAVNCFYLKAGAEAYVVAGTNSYFTGITGSSTAVVKVQAGVTPYV